ncbi:riboflavin synthase [Fodinibius sediminis]|uniref:Riboflavin synthase n=1 Tax=Fodinibius sediminis TaxID=1214077 RepID=A0A521AH34_9BACT|nr:riboflavin synthase [Fodinibius sediminis]SMO34116.1 riboflavin synthase alpha chain [Fodinibius sediminis]
MFTGIIQEVGELNRINMLDGGRELTIGCSFAGELNIDQSISINGVCHTVTRHDQATFTVQSVEETLRKTNIGTLEEGNPVNLERSLRPDQLLDGHLVQGHVDAVGTIEQIQKEGTDWLITVSYPPENAALVVGRGSVALDGISLTVADEQDHAFTVAIIPYTFEHTNLKAREEGDAINLEFDVLGKYVIKYMEQRDR